MVCSVDAHQEMAPCANIHALFPFTELVRGRGRVFVAAAGLLTDFSFPVSSATQLATCCAFYHGATHLHQHSFAVRDICCGADQVLIMKICRDLGVVDCVKLG